MEKAAPQPLAARGREAPVGKGAASEDAWLHQTKPTLAWETPNEAMTACVRGFKLKKYQSTSSACDL